jgi:hypothetical protein
MQLSVHQADPSTRLPTQHWTVILIRSRDAAFILAVHAILVTTCGLGTGREGEGFVARTLYADALEGDRKYEEIMRSGQ